MRIAEGIKNGTSYTINQRTANHPIVDMDGKRIETGVPYFVVTWQSSQMAAPAFWYFREEVDARRGWTDDADKNQFQLTDRGREQLRELRVSGTIQPSPLEQIRTIMNTGSHYALEDALRTLIAIREVLDANPDPFAS